MPAGIWRSILLYYNKYIYEHRSTVWSQHPLFSARFSPISHRPFKTSCAEHKVLSLSVVAFFFVECVVARLHQSLYRHKIRILLIRDISFPSEVVTRHTHHTRAHRTYQMYSYASIYGINITYIPVCYAMVMKSIPILSIALLSSCLMTFQCAILFLISPTLIHIRTLGLLCTHSTRIGHVRNRKHSYERKQMTARKMSSLPGNVKKFQCKTAIYRSNNRCCVGFPYRMDSVVHTCKDVPSENVLISCL